MNLDLLSTPKDDENCIKELKAIETGLKTFQLWAFKVVDSWGKIPSGILVGHLTDLGNFDECIYHSHLIDEKTEQLFEGKYCFAEFSLSDIIEGIIKGLLPLNVPPKIEPKLETQGSLKNLEKLKLGICIPKSCQSAKIIDDAIREALKKLNIDLNKDKTFVQMSTCKTKLIPSFRTIDIVAISLFSFIGFLMVLSSLYDYSMACCKKQPIKILIAFSIITNGRKLFKIQGNSKSNPNVIECLNGIRSLSIIWVVFGHQYFVSTFGSTINGADLLEWTRTPFALLVLNGILAVDSFFLLSGCLVTWVVFKTMEKSDGKLNIFKMYLHRYLRLTPLLAVMVLFTASLQRYMGNGPFWDFNKLEEDCQNYWWSTLLYVSNYVHPDKMCFGVAWYLDVDTQLFFLSPLILIPLWKWGKIVFLPIIVAIQASMGYVLAEWIYREYHYLPLEYNDNDVTKQKYIYYATHARVSPYLIGIILGFYLYKCRDKKIKLKKYLIAIGWLSCLIVIGAILFGPYHRSNKQPNSGMTTMEGAFYEPFSRFSWAIALSWIIFACHHGFGGLVNKILTFGMWQPIARLTYGIYLSHIVVQLIWYGNLKIEKYFSDLDLIFMFWGCFGVTLCVTVLLVLAFESPILVIESCIFGNRINNKQNQIIEPTTSAGANIDTTEGGQLNKAYEIERTSL